MVWHICPVNDLHEHLTGEEDSCPCSPVVKVDEDTGDLMYVHNSWDGREVREQLIQGLLDDGIPN